MFTIVIGWLAFSIAVGLLAQRYDRSAAGWLMISILFSPLVAGIFLLAIGHNKDGGAIKITRDIHRSDKTNTGTLIFAFGYGTFILSGLVVYIMCMQRGAFPNVAETYGTQVVFWVAFALVLSALTPIIIIVRRYVRPRLGY